MGMHDTGAQMLDTFGVPEHWTCCIGAIEDAGDGQMRIIKCIRRGGVLIPVFSNVLPAASILRDGPRIREFAERIVSEDFRHLVGQAN